ncbi:MAG: 3-hydroxyacyl-CoA dehydrogenase NAD-binding domain-containing protein, partial [Mariprofundaceae bacterium]|nr:3-hydroxyacyl-CoA dehydrogenase NAD-binding domain-containing protein [Mariprofundaceae bacterium]
LLAYLHLAAAPELLRVLLQQGVRALAYETVALEDGSLPLLAPMSQIAGRVSVLMAAQYLRVDFNKAKEKISCCKGMLLGGIPGIDSGRVTILGAGEVGRQAAHMALALGAEVILLDCRQAALNVAAQKLNGSLYTEILSDEALRQYLPKTDVLLGAALIAGARAPQLLSAEYLSLMEAGSVFMDVAIDQGGVSTTSRLTSYDEPVYSCEGVWHCCLPNFPACVPHSSSLALVAASLRYIRQWANLGLQQAIERNSALAKGVNTWDGAVVHSALSHLIQS